MGCGLNIKPIDLNSPIWQTIWELYTRSDFALVHCRKLIETAQAQVSQ